MLEKIYLRNDWKENMLNAKKYIISNLKVILKELILRDLTEAEINLKSPEEIYGDYSTNVAMQVLRGNPMETAQKLKAKFAFPDAIIQKIEVVKPGFINFWLTEDYLQNQVLEIIQQGRDYGRSNLGKGKKARVEFISANPTGPLHIGNARGGPIGDVLSNVLEKAGFEVTREYLNNDVGGQVKQLGATMYFELNPDKTPEEDLWYRGSYIKDLSKKVDKIDRKSSKVREQLSYDEQVERLGKIAVEILFEEIIEDVKAMGIRFDLVRKESDLRKEVPKVLKDPRLKKVLKEKDKALWFAPASRLGGPSDEFLKDRETVVRKSDGEYTYFASDIVYHKEKFEAADLVVDVLGSNHSGHVPRLQAAIKSLGFDVSKFKVILYQFVRVKKEGLAVKMSKRQGEFVTAREVLDLVGKDVFRFFLLMSAPESHMDFDLELATKKANDNPVFYVQYANSRISSIFKKTEQDFSSSNTSLLKEKEEILLIRHLIKFPDLVEDISQNFSVHWLTAYAYDLANLFHKFYESHTVLSADKEKSQSRLALLKAVQTVLKETLDLLGVSSPEKM